MWEEKTRSRGRGVCSHRPGSMIIIDPCRNTLNIIPGGENYREEWNGHNRRDVADVAVGRIQAETAVWRSSPLTGTLRVNY